MINVETELDRALSRLVDAEDRIDELNQAIAEKDDAIEALLGRHETDAAEVASLTVRIAELERLLASKAAG
jgi:hypothetical protein